MLQYFRLHRKTLLKMQMDELIEFLQKSLAEDFLYEEDYVIETALRENLHELRSSRLSTAGIDITASLPGNSTFYSTTSGPPPDAELPQKPFGLVHIPKQEQYVRIFNQLNAVDITTCFRLICQSELRWVMMRRRSTGTA